MATSVADLQAMFKRGVHKNSKYMIIICDTYDWEDYPFYVGADDDFWKIYDEHNGKNMQKIMEGYGNADGRTCTQHSSSLIPLSPRMEILFITSNTGVNQCLLIQ